MRWNPFLNGLGAAAYVWGVALLVNHIARLHQDTPDNVVGSIAALSIGVFSAAVMAFLFFYRPVVLLLEHKREEALAFFLKTLATFGALTALAVFTLL